MIFLPILVFVLGLIVGSFLNVVILRMNTGRSVVSGRSKCASCSTTLHWYELIPVFSFLGLRGKCRSCKASISFQYPFVELVTAIVFVILYTKIVLVGGLTFLTVGSFIGGAVAAALLIVITVYDIRHKIIPNQIVYPFIALSFVSIIWKTIMVPGFLPTPFIIAGPVLAAPFFLIWFISKGTAMGFGDVKLALGMGWFLGIASGIAAFFLSFWIGAAVGLLLIAFSQAKMKSQIPFAPFLILAFTIVSLWGVTLSTLFPIW
jgi:leader peptidase (prepilin peptidase)/N-methyltransferase